MGGVIVHEWVEPRGGAENVFEALSRIYPDADRWCLWNDAPERFPGVHETVLARTPLRRSKAAALPFMPSVWRHLPAREADWVLCSSHLFAHHARFGGPARTAPKLVYAHTPARYVWTPELDRRGDSAAARLASALLKPLDRGRAQEPVAIAANSAFVAQRIRETWEREASVIHPPIDVGAFARPVELTTQEESMLEGLPDQFLLGASRFVQYKRLDLAIAAGAAAGLPVVLAGDGPDRDRLEAIATQRREHVVFVPRPPHAVLVELFRRATAFVFAPIEDFGIMPVEAMAAGTPVVANAIGGAAESVVDGVTGAHVSDWADAAALRSAVERAAAADPEACIARAYQFDVPVFEERIRAWVAQHAGVGAAGGTA